MTRLTPKWKTRLAYVLGFGTLGTGSVTAWELGWLEAAWLWLQSDAPIAIDETPRSATPTDTLAWETVQGFPAAERPALPPSAEDHAPDPDEWHSAEPLPEARSGYARTTTKRPEGVRVGSICMDNDRQDNRGAGACAGHGGVRFWLYQQRDGRLLEHPTKRHRDHPSELSSTELANLSFYNKKQHHYTSDQEPDFQPYFFLFTAVMFICLTIAYVAKLWWDPNRPQP